MPLTRTTRLALKVLIALADGGPRLRTLPEVADGAQAGRAAVDGVLRRLRAAGVVVSRTGPNGGYGLSPMALDLSVGDLSDILDAGPVLAPCARPGSPRCDRCPAGRPCAIRPALIAAEGAGSRAVHTLLLRDMLRPRRPGALGGAGPPMDFSAETVNW